MSSPTGWVYLPSGHCTIRWQRGDRVAYLFEGKQLHTYPDEPLQAEILATIPVSTKGWSDLADIRNAGEKWIKTTHPRCPACRGRR